MRLSPSLKIIQVVLLKSILSLFCVLNQRRPLLSAVVAAANPGVEVEPTDPAEDPSCSFTSSPTNLTVRVDSPNGFRSRDTTDLSM